MNINNHSAKGPERTNHANLSHEVSKKGPARSKSAESTSRSASDKIVISDRAKALGAELAARPGESTDQRAQRVTQLRELALSGKLNTPERAAESADRILGGR